MSMFGKQDVPRADITPSGSKRLDMLKELWHIIRRTVKLFPKMFDILLIFTALRTGRSRTTFYCLAALLFLTGPWETFAQSDPSTIDVRLFRDINNAQSQFKTSLIGVSDNSVYPILIVAPISLAAYGLAANHNEEFESGVLLGSSEILAYSIGYVLKESVRRERPYKL